MAKKDLKTLKKELKIAKQKVADLHREIKFVEQEEKLAEQAKELEKMQRELEELKRAKTVEEKTDKKMGKNLGETVNDEKKNIGASHVAKSGGNFDELMEDFGG